LNDFEVGDVGAMQFVPMHEALPGDRVRERGVVYEDAEDLPVVLRAVDRTCVVVKSLAGERLVSSAGVEAVIRLIRVPRI
jgi:hypothetical protein